MKKKLLALTTVGIAGYLVSRRRRPNPADVSTEHPERTVERMERVAGEPVRP